MKTQRTQRKARPRRSFSPPVFQALIFIASAAVLGFSTLVIAASTI